MRASRLAHSSLSSSYSLLSEMSPLSVASWILGVQLGSAPRAEILQLFFEPALACLG